MNEEATPQRPGFFRRLVSAPGRLSLAAKASWLLLLFLILLVGGAWTVFWLDPQSVPWWHAMRWWRVVGVLGLVLIIPLVVYRGLRLWLEGEKSQFPDLDYAWQAGLDALQEHGLSLDSAPLILVLGSPDEFQEKALLAASGRPLRVAGVPDGPAPLHWYANPDAIYLVCTEAGWLSALAAVQQKKVAAGSSRIAAAPGDASQPVPQAPPDPAPQVAAEPSPPQPPGGGGGGTVMLDQFISEQAAHGQGPAATEAADRDVPGDGPAGPSSAQQQPGRGTLLLGAPLAQPAATATPPVSSTWAPAVEAEPALVPPKHSAEQLRRLQYVVQRIRQARQPICGLNGILTLLPFEMIQASPAEVEELERAIKSDLLTVQRTLQLRCPVTALVVGLEKERGFRELVRRVGPQRAAAQRFGRKFDVRCTATREDLTALATHLCGAFEDWVYTLFREKQALTRPGNPRLYGLLCKVRCTWKTRLAEILATGFGYDRLEDAGDEPLLFSGCYFAATGPTPDRQAFVKGIFDKLEEEQELVQWTRQGLAEHRRLRLLGYGALALCGTLLLTLTAMIASRTLQS